VIVGLSPLAQALFDSLAERMYTLTDEGHRLPRGLGWAGHRSTKVGALGSGVGRTGFSARTGRLDAVLAGILFARLFLYYPQHQLSTEIVSCPRTVGLMC